MNLFFPRASGTWGEMTRKDSQPGCSWQDGFLFVLSVRLLSDSIIRHRLFLQILRAIDEMLLMGNRIVHHAILIREVIEIR